MITPPISIANGFRYHPGDIGHAQVKWAGARTVQQTVHGHERSSGGDRRGKATTRGEAVIQAPRQEARLAHRVVMWQAALVESRHA